MYFKECMLCKLGIYTLLEVFRSGTSLSDFSLLSISSQFLSLSLNNILKKHTNPGEIFTFSFFLCV